MCMDKRNEFRETFLYILHVKGYLRLSKNSADMWITLPYVYILYKKRYKYCN